MHVVSRAPFDTAARHFPYRSLALDDLCQVLKKEHYPSPDDMRKRFPSLDRMKYREKWWVIDVGGGHLRIIFLLILNGERSSLNTSARTQSMTSSRTSTGERKNELCSSHQSGKRAD